MRGSCSERRVNRLAPFPCFVCLRSWPDGDVLLPRGHVWVRWGPAGVGLLATALDSPASARPTVATHAHLPTPALSFLFYSCRYLEFPASAMSNILLNYSGALELNYLCGFLQLLDCCQIATSCTACWAFQTHAAQHAPLAPSGWLEPSHRRWTIWSCLTERGSCSTASSCRRQGPADGAGACSRGHHPNRCAAVNL